MLAVQRLTLDWSAVWGKKCSNSEKPSPKWIAEFIWINQKAAERLGMVRKVGMLRMEKWKVLRFVEWLAITDFIWLNKGASERI